MTTPQTLIAIAVVEHHGSFLIGRRPEGAPLAGLWEFPGGKVEPGETAEQAARRECLEEAGLEVEVIGEYPPHVHKYAHGRVELRFFACRPLNAAQPPKPPFRWVPREELSGYEFPEGNRELLGLLAQVAASGEHPETILELVKRRAAEVAEGRVPTYPHEEVMLAARESLQNR